MPKRIPLSHCTEKNKKIYGNCQVLSPDDILMFRCDDKKGNWYLKRGLAEVINKNPLVIKLNFKPKGLGNHNRGFGLEEIHNRCVVCGSEEYLTRHHIVPYCYRKYFPEELKSHNFHDVVSMCASCHDSYERKADELKLELAIKYNAPLNAGIEVDNKLIKLVKIAKTLLYTKSIPKKRIDFLKKVLKTELNVGRLSNSKIEKISNMEYVKIKKTHGEIVMSNIYDIQDFIKMWRQHFMKNNNCKYLSKNWNTNFK